MPRPPLTLLLVACVPLLAEEAVLELDPARTAIHFTLGATLHTVHGSFRLKRGTIRFDTATGGASGEVIVDLTSAETGNDGRDRRMHKEILETQRYPEAVFTPGHIEGRLAPQGESQVDVYGRLKIHGAEHELTLHMQVRANGDQLTGQTHVSIPYVKWGIKNPSTFVLRVNKDVEIDVQATGHARPAP